MTITIPENIKQELLKFIESGDEAKARDFIIENLKAFPQETQDAIIVAVLEEALEQKNGDGLVSDLRKKVIEAATVLGEAKEELDKQIKLAEIKEKI